MAVERMVMTLDEFLALPEERPALEYVDGEVVQKVAPSTPHSALQYFFCAAINNYTLPRRLAWAFPEHRTTHSGRSTVPDVTVYTWDRVPRDANRRLAERNFVIPDIAVEIRSPDSHSPISLPAVSGTSRMVRRSRSRSSRATCSGWRSDRPPSRWSSRTRGYLT
jgi:Uma2 family endonuclease